MKTQQKLNCFVSGLCFGGAIVHLQNGHWIIAGVMVTLGIINTIAGFSK